MKKILHPLRYLFAEASVVHVLCLFTVILLLCLSAKQLAIILVCIASMFRKITSNK